MRSFGRIQIRINDPTGLGSWCIKGTKESTLGKDSSVPLMHHDPSDIGSLPDFIPWGSGYESVYYGLWDSTPT